MTRFWSAVRTRSPLIRIILYLGAIVLISSPLALPLYRWEYATTDGRSVIWAPLSLLAVFLLFLPQWMRSVHRCRRPWRSLGFAGGWLAWRSGIWAFAVGALMVVLLYGVQLALGWGIWVAPDAGVGAYLLEGLLVGIGVGIAEELLFRGWLLFELERNYSAAIALILNAGIFAIAHYLRPIAVILATWPQMVGLFLLGVALVWARRMPLISRHASAGVTSLSAAAGLHGGLVFAYYQFDVNDLVLTTHRVPEWVTGIGGNPLAGLLGICFLIVLNGGVYYSCHRSRSPKVSR